MAIFFTPHENGTFIDSESRPEAIVNGVGVGEHAGAVEITDELYELVMLENSQGKTIVMGEDGFPMAVDSRDLLTADEKWEYVRKERSALLMACDYTQVADFPGDQAAWVIYRTALRDIPETYAADPDSVIWPTPPA